jgi:1,2-phenylacetyl-CoA epoxidase catalytic subunit
VSACACLKRLLERQGQRELSAAHLFAAGVPLAPSLDEKQMLARHCLDELGHFEQIAAVAEEAGAGDLMAATAKRVASLPIPGSWLEMVVVGVSYDSAVYFQLRAYAAAPDARVADLAVRVTADERDHLAAAEAALMDLAKAETEFSARLGSHVERWLPLALANFDGPDVEVPGCPDGPHLSLTANAEAKSGYLSSMARLFVPLGVPATRFSET